MRKYRVAVIGCGALARGTHLPNTRKNPRLELVCACDISRAAAEKCRGEFGAERAETDWRRVIDADDIDLVVLATTHHVRGEVIIPALRAGKPVYTEKPLAPSLAEMGAIVRETRRTGVPVCVGHNRRSGPAVLEFRRLLEKARRSGAAPAPSVHRNPGRALVPEERQQQLLLRVNDDARSWKEWIFREEEGILFSEMVHFIDLALWFNPSPPVRGFAEGSCRGNFTLLLRFADGSLATIQHSMVGNFDYPKELFEASVNNVTIALDHHVEVRQMGLNGEEKRSAFPYGDGRMDGMAGYYRDIGAIKINPGEKSPLGVNKGHYDQLERFAEHVAGRAENPCDIESAVAVNRVALKLLESIRLGLPVAVSPEDWHLP